MRPEVENILEVIRRSHLEFEEYEEMEQALREALTRYPQDPDLEDELIMVLRKQSKLIEPELVVRQNHRRVTKLMQAEKFADAIPLLLHAQGIESTAAISDLIGHCYYKLGDNSAAVVNWYGDLERIVDRYLVANNPGKAEWLLLFLYKTQPVKTPDVIQLLAQVYSITGEEQKYQELLQVHQDVFGDDDEEETITEDDGDSTDTDIDLGSSDGDNVERSAVDVAMEIASRILDKNDS